jgi:hypothetical protein
MHGAKQLWKGQVLRLSSITFYQNTRHIPRLDSATDKGFNTYFFVFSNNKTQKRTLSANRSPGERILRFELYLFWHPKWTLHVGTLLETIDILLQTHFRFGSPVGDSLILASFSWEMLDARQEASSCVAGIWNLHPLWSGVGDYRPLVAGLSSAGRFRGRFSRTFSLMPSLMSSKLHALTGG